MASLREKAVKGVIWSALPNTLGPLISFFVFFILARLVEPAAFGLLALAAVAVNFFQLFLSGGFGSALVQREFVEPEHLNTAFWANIGAAAVLVTLVIGSSGLISELYSEPELEPIIKWLSFKLLFDAMTQVQVAQLRRNLAFRSLALRSMAAEPIGGLVGVMMALSGFGVWSLVGRILVTSYCQVLVLWLASDWRPGTQVSRKHFNDLFHFGANMVGSSLVVFLSRRSDTLLIGYYLGSTALGYYNVGCRLFRMMTEMIGGTLNNVAWPLFSKLQSDLPKLREAFYTSTRLVCLFACPVFFGTFYVAPDLVPIVFGEKWIPSIPIMQVLSFMGLLYSVSFFNETMIVSVGKPQWRLLLQFAIAIANIVVFFLVVRWGIVAVTIGYVIVGYAFAPVSLWMVKRLIEIKYLTYLWQYVVPLTGSGIMLTAIFTMKNWRDSAWLSQIQHHEQWFLASLIASGVFTYFLTVYWLSPSTVTLVTRLIKDLKAKSGRKK